MITGARLNGVPLDPCMVLANVTVVHGRGGFGETGSPSSTTIEILHPAGMMPDWQSGDILELVDADNVSMFAGRVVERKLAHTDKDGTRMGLFTVTAAGALAALGVRMVGDTPWPQETGAQRAGRILVAADVRWRVQGVLDLQVLARDVDRQPAAGLLDELAEWTGAAVFDTPTGEVVYQAMASRTRIHPYRWNDFDPALTWNDFDPALTWDGDPPSIGQWPSPASQFPTVLPCDAVVWEPEWFTSEAAVINQVTVAYGPADPQAEVELADAASIGRHSRRHLSMSTGLAGAADATARATHILTTQHAERWQIGDVTVALGALDTTTRGKVLGLLCGDHVTLEGLPQPAPATDWTGIVEGWTYTMWADGGQFHEQMVLTLSDPLLSLVVMQWQDYTATYLWSDHPDALTWDDLETTSVLEAA